METFHIAILTIAAAVLILILTSVGTLIRDANSDAAWPPGEPARCPDGWTETTPGSNKCKVPNMLISSGQVYSDYNADSTPKLTGYTEDSAFTDTVDYTYDSTFNKYKVSVTGNLQGARAFVKDRTIQIGVATAKIGAVDAVVGVKPSFNTTGLTTGEYDVYESTQKLLSKQPIGKATATSATKLEFTVGPTSTITATTLYLANSAGTVTSASGIYAAGSASVSFTATATGTGTLPTTSPGTIKFKTATVDFNDSAYTRCAKKTFADKFGLVWEGVSMYNKC